MLDTRSHSSVVHSPDGFDHRISTRPGPSFGWASLRSRKWLLGLTTLVFCAAGLFYTQYRATTYTASGQLLVYIKQILTGADLAVLPGRADLPLVQNQIELLRSGNVLAQVIEALQLYKDPEFSSHPGGSFETQKVRLPSSSSRAGRDYAAHRAALYAVKRSLSIRQIGTSHMVRVNFKASEPEKAARIVNSLIRIYFQELLHASDAISSKAPELRELYQSLGPSALLISEAEPPVVADGPAAALIVIVAGLLGLSLAAATAILLDAMNDTIRNARQLEHALGLECLGVFRRRPDGYSRGHDPAVERSEQQALRRVAATALEPSLRGPRTLGVTSTLPNEGVTTLAVALADTAVALGKRVLLIDGVQRISSPSCATAHSPRVSSFMEGDASFKRLDGVMVRPNGLNVLTRPGSAEGDSSIQPAWLDETLGVAAESYDLVIVDMPSLVEGPDVRAAAQLLDGFLLVVKWGSTDSELVRQAFQSAGGARAKFIGAVLYMADDKALRLYGGRLPAEADVATAP